MKLERLVLAATFVLLVSPPTQAQQSAADYHVVQRGETLSKIAQRYGIDYRELAAWNQITDPSRVRVGQRLRLTAPAVASAAAPPAVPTAVAPVAAPRAGPEPDVAAPVAETQPADAATTAAPQPEPAPAPAPMQAVADRAPEPAPAAPPPTRVVEAGSPAEQLEKQKVEMEALRQTQMNLIKLLVDSGILTRERAEELVAQSKRQAATEVAAQATAEQKVIRVPYVPQTVKDQIKDELRDEVIAQAKSEQWGAGSIPEWTERIKISGDLRLRYQSNGLSGSNGVYLNPQATNAGNGVVLYNTTDSYDTWRYRARIGLDAIVNDWMTAGFKVVTGNTENPVTFDQNLGGNSFAGSSIVLEAAYLKMTPLEGMTIWGGRFANPFFYTNLVWDDELHLDGAAVSYSRALQPATTAFGTIGAFPIELQGCTNSNQILACGQDKWLYGAQVGVEQAMPAEGKLKVGLAYYAYDGISGQFNDPVVDPNSRAYIPKWMQKGNTVFNVVTSGGNPLVGLAADYDLLNLTATYDIAQFNPFRVQLFGDYVENVGYSRSKTAKRTQGLVDEPGQTTGYQLGLNVGSATIAKWGDWDAFVAYKYLEADAVVDGYTDSDFHLGGTDAKGYIIGGNLGVAKNAWVRARYISANEINGAPYSVDLLQIDLNARF